MKKALNYLEFPFTVEEIKRIILLPESYKIRNYKSCRRVDDATWIEDYGDDYLVKYHVSEDSDCRLVLENYRIMDIHNYVKELIFTFELVSEHSCIVRVQERVKSGSVVRRITVLADSYSKTSTYLIDMLEKLLKHCRRAR